MPILDEDLFTLNEATKIFPKRNGKRPHFTTILRWCFKGVHGVRLESYRIGGTHYTSREAIERFIANGSESVRRMPSDSEKIRAEIATRFLKRNGVC